MDIDEINSDLKTLREELTSGVSSPVLEVLIREKIKDLEERETGAFVIDAIRNHNEREGNYEKDYKKKRKWLNKQ